MARCIAVVGGKLQGTEAVYLAKKAGFHTLLIDKDRHVPAAGLCDDILVHRFSDAKGFPLTHVVPDLILPAIEDNEVLERVCEWGRQCNIPVAFDLDAYKVTCSKIKSDTLFRELNLPVPEYFPNCTFPVVVKPDQASGSQGVEIFHTQQAFRDKFSNHERMDGLVIQEYLEGPSYSIEVVGTPDQHFPLQVTDLGMDNAYDCNRVTAPTQLSDDHVRSMADMARNLSQALNLNGIMDLEVILHENQLKLLEIDARLPSQTPMAVYWSTGLNMVQVLADCFSGRSVVPVKSKQMPVCIEHIRVSKGNIDFLGEHIMGEHGPLHLEKAFFGATEAVTSFLPGRDQWVATLIFTGQTQDDMLNSRDACLKRIEKSNM